jgi:hypothetical protein
VLGRNREVGNTGLQPVQPADTSSAENDSGLKTRWPRRLKVCVPHLAI